MASCNTIRLPSLSSPEASQNGDGQEQEQSGLHQGVEQQEHYTLGDKGIQTQMQFGAGDGSLHQHQSQRHGGKFQEQEQENGFFGSQMQVSYTDKNETHTFQEQEMFDKSYYLDPTQKIKKRVPFSLPFGN